MSEDGGYIAVTDREWFEFLKSRNHKNRVVFWTRKTKPSPVKNLIGLPFFFLVKGKRPRLIEGYGIVEDADRETVQTLWNLYGTRCGEGTLDALVSRIGKSTMTYSYIDRNEKIAYYLLKDVRYLEDGVDPENFGIRFNLSIVSGKKITNDETAKLLEAFGDEI